VQKKDDAVLVCRDRCYRGADQGREGAEEESEDGGRWRHVGDAGEFADV